MENKAPHLIRAWLAQDGRMASWLASQIGATRPMVSSWLNCRSIPIAMYRDKLAKITGLDIADKGAWE